MFKGVFGAEAGVCENMGFRTSELAPTLVLRSSFFYCRSN